MGALKVWVNLNRIGDDGSKIEVPSFGRVFSSRIEMLASRTDILNTKDRAIMKMYLKNGLTFRQIAQVAGTNESVISRKIRKLTSKLIDGEYITCLRNRDKFNRVEMAVAKDHFLNGMSQMKIAEKHGMTVYSARKLLRKILRIVDSCGGRRGAGSGSCGSVIYHEELEDKT
ncbi:MAG: hypothetical protein K9M75_09485 [Phycisphaerae bacterium]|nr:hypothetical protein [Phycisphaerae bacterium]